MKATAHNTALQRRYEKMQRTLRQIMRRHPRADADNIWHALLLLELPPIERLRRGLLRGQKSHLH